MKHFLIIPAALVFWALFNVYQAEDSEKAECCNSVKAAVNISGQGIITCHFPMDLIQQQDNMSLDVNRYPGDDNVVNCALENLKKDGCENYWQEGYTYSNFTNNTLIIEIPKLAQEHIAEYRYKLMNETRVVKISCCEFEFTVPEKGMLTFDSGIGIGICIGIGIGIGIVIVIVIVIVGIGVDHYRRHRELGIPSCCLRCLEWVCRRLPFPGQGGPPDGGDTDQEQQNEGDNIQMENQGDGQNAPSATGGAADNRADHRTTPPPADPQEGVTGPEESNTENEESSPFLKFADPLSAPPGSRQKGEQSQQPRSSHYSHT